MSTETATVIHGQTEQAKRANALGDVQDSLAEAKAALDALSPLKVLSRGYSVMTDGAGRVVRGSDEVAVGDAVHVRLARGELDCRVEKRTEEDL